MEFAVKMRMHGWWFAWGLACLLAAGAAAQSSGTKPKSSAPAAQTSSTKAGSTKAGSTKTASNKAATGAVATVGGLQITRAAFDQRVRTAEENYRERTGAVPSPGGPGPQTPGAGRADPRAAVARGRSAAARGPHHRAGRGRGEEDPFFQTGGMFDEAKFLASGPEAPTIQAVVADVRNTVPPFGTARKSCERTRPQRHVRARL
jgi:hypothetical protein